MYKLFVLLLVLTTTTCSFPVCPDCKATVNINDASASVVVNVCFEVRLQNGTVVPCQDAGADAPDDADDDSATLSE